MSDNEYPDEYLDENGNEYQEEKPEQERGELKPCPFCGEPVEFNKFAEKVVCEDCGATIYSDYWNTRPIEDALNARIAELELRLDVYNGNMYDVVVDENAKANKRIAELEAELTELKERFDITDGLLNQANCFNWRGNSLLYL